MNAKPANERQRDHYERMKAAGMKKVSVYVPEDRVPEIRKIAEKMRRKTLRK